MMITTPQLENMTNEFLEQQIEQNKVYKKEVCAILADHFYPVEVDQELIPFIDFDTQEWLLSPKNVSKFEHLVRKQEFYSIFYNLFFINFNNFTTNVADYIFGDSEDEVNFFSGLEFNQANLSSPIWKFHHKMLFFVIFLPIGITWIFVRNIYIATVCRILSWVFVYFGIIALVFLKVCSGDDGALYFLGTCGGGVVILTFFIPLYSIVFVLYTFLWTIVEIFSWILAICFSFNLKIYQGRMAHPDNGLIKAKVADGRIILKAKILSQTPSNCIQD